METTLEKEIIQQGFQIPILKENVNKMDSPQKLFQSLREEVLEEKRECLGAVALDTRNNVIWSGLIHIGSVNTSLCHPREIFRSAICLAAAGVVLIHNHPSREVQPSQEDYETAEILKASGDILGIQLLDFIIVGGDTLYSFAQKEWAHDQ